ncbi:MAG: hypothetical protein RLZZ416_409 [Candidatus Parcubacteria bacterium]|jgi:glutamyl-tRNA synthetase
MAILNYLFAKKNDGAIIFRSEDTDKERSRVEFEEDIIEQLHWLGLSWDEFHRQSERTAAYRAAIEKLIAEGKAYSSDEESKKDPGTRVAVIRLKNPGTKVTFRDLIRGDITFDTAELKDFAIARSADDPLYHLAVVVDDADMGITHVIRGEDHISNTPRQILIQEALGVSRPAYAHYPLHLSPERAKLSKRTGDVAVRDYRSKGYLAPALLNYLAVLGWTPPSQRELISLQEMVEEFDLKDLHKSGAIFDIEKLNWFNREYLRAMPRAGFIAYYMPTLRAGLESRGIACDPPIAERIASLLSQSIHSTDQLASLVESGEYDFFFADPKLDASKIPERKSSANEAENHLRYAIGALDGVDFESETAIKDALWDYASEHGRGAVLWPLRYALTGKERSPDPFVVASIIGKDSTLRRIDAALRALPV